MTWMIQITLEEWRALGGLGNPELRRTVNAIGRYSYFKPGE